VRYGLSAGQLSQSATATDYTYTQTEMCGAPANSTGWRAPGTFYTAVLSSLPVNSKVFYQFGDAATSNWSPVRSFITRPAPGNPVAMVAFGDLGQHVLDHSLQESVRATPTIAVLARGQAEEKVGRQRGGVAAGF
jgi:hypothetical protein